MGQMSTETISVISKVLCITFQDKGEGIYNLSSSEKGHGAFQCGRSHKGWQSCLCAYSEVDARFKSESITNALEVPAGWEENYAVFESRGIGLSCQELTVGHLNSLESVKLRGRNNNELC